MSYSTDILFFHSKSARVLPGKGVHETVADVAAYQTLKNNPRWREALSNFWISPFTWTDGHRYNTVEHCFQAQKLYIPYSENRDVTRAATSIPFEGTHEFAMFCLDATVEIWGGIRNADGIFHYFQESVAKQDGAAAQKKRKLYVLTASELAHWDSIKNTIMESAQYAKFNQNPTLREVLLATGKAQLWHGAARQPPVRMLCLERVRERLRSGQGCAEATADSDTE